MTDKKPAELGRNPNDPLKAEEYVRLATNFYTSQGLDPDLARIKTDMDLTNYLAAHLKDVDKRVKVAFVWICLNPTYWEFARQMLNGAKQYFLPGQDTDYFLWSDMPQTKDEVKQRFLDYAKANGAQLDEMQLEIKAIEIADLHKEEKLTIFPIDPIEWPMPTLLRYHTFLQQEEILKTYDYIFYCDVDMLFVNVVGDEILGDGLTAGVNPMYYLDKSMFPPYEPNPDSTAYIPRPGRLIEENGQKRFQPLYYAGGFQGGRADKFLEAMKVIKKRIDQDLNKNYIAIWNEESHWNKYLFENPPSVVLNPSYIYPDSLHKEYYIPRWGRDYQPKLVTLTKKFTLRQLSPQEQEQLMMMKK